MLRSEPTGTYLRRVLIRPFPPLADAISVMRQLEPVYARLFSLESGPDGVRDPFAGRACLKCLGVALNFVNRFADSIEDQHDGAMA